MNMFLLCTRSTFVGVTFATLRFCKGGGAALKGGGGRGGGVRLFNMPWCSCCSGPHVGVVVLLLLLLLPLAIPFAPLVAVAMLGMFAAVLSYEGI